MNVSHMPKSMIVFSLLISIFIVSICVSSSAFAHGREGGWNNSAEKEAYDLCYSAGSGGNARGSIWISKEGSTYYDDSVDVAYNTSNVDVEIRGSVYGCESTTAGGDFYAIGINPSGWPAGCKLDGLDSTKLFRGTLPSDSKNHWSSQGSEVSAKLDLGCVPNNTTTSSKTTTFSIDLYRCPSRNGTTASGECYASEVKIHVTRGPRPAQWTIVPTGAVQQYATPGANVQFSWSLDNNGPDNATKSIDAVARWSTYASTPLNVNVANPGGHDDTRCDRTASYYQVADSPVTGCTNSFTVPLTAAVGSKYCQVVRIFPYKWNDTAVADDATTHYKSSQICTIVAKSPHLQVHGGDLRVFQTSNNTCTASNYSIKTSLTKIGTKNYGSWGEFAALSRCNNIKFATGTGLANGSSSASQTSWSDLTFKNVGGFGVFATNANVYNTSASQPASCSMVPGITASSTYTSFSAFKAANNLNSITGTKCIQAGTVFIDANMRLRNTPADIDAIPQVIIIANTIKVRHDVRRVDAWLIANSKLYTCVKTSGGIYSSLATNLCNKQLVINGPVYTNKLYPYRTHGAYVGSETLAGEVFNLPASTALWRYGEKVNEKAFPTVSIEELPPRY